MKKLVLVSLLTLGLGVGVVYANQAAVELEHANKTATSIEGVSGDMSAMKAAGKCGADQMKKSKSMMKKKAHTPSKAELELEHANKLATSEDSVDGDMGDMKAQGKCNTGGDKAKEAPKTMKCGQGKCGGKM